MTDDESFNSMSDYAGAVTVKTVNGKPFVSDEQTLLEIDFAAACKAMVEAENKFQAVNREARAQKGVPENLVEWFDALEDRYVADKKLWELFTGADRSPRSNKMYNEFRLILLQGKTTRPNA